MSRSIALDESGRLQVVAPEAGGGRLERPLGENPYKGLEAFDERDAGRFYGRDAVVSRLLARYGEILDRDRHEAARVLAVLGPSGSGKSSIVRAGLIPELVRRPLPGLRNPLIAYMRPNTRPLWELALVLARIDGGERPIAAAAADYEAILRAEDAGADHGRTGLRRIADSLAGADNRSLIVLVDQFEETYTLADNGTEAQVFVEALLAAARDPSGRVSVILTMRSDFLGETIANPELNAVIAESAVIVPAMTAGELREAIEEPARAAGHELDAAVVDLLIAETEGRTGALPLLQFALTQIWDGLVAGREPSETLREIGGVGGALAAIAEDRYSRLPPPDRAIARRAFLAMISLGEGARDTRRRVPISEIVAAGEDPAHVKHVLDRFSQPDARLVTQAGDGAEITVEVTHETLFEHWTSLEHWLDASRDDIRFQRQLNEAVRKWNEGGRASGDLWRPPSLDRLADFVKRHGDLTEDQLAFFHASRHAQRRSSLLRSGAFAAVALAVFSGLFGFYALEARERAEDLRIEAQSIQSRFLADLAREQTTRGATTIAMQLALTALGDDRPVTHEAQVALLDALVAHRETGEVPTGSASARILGFGADGAYALVGDEERKARAVVDLASRAALEVPGDARGIAALHPGRPIMAAALGGGRVSIRGLPDFREARVIEPGSGDVARLAFSSDGSRLYVAASLGIDVIATSDWSVAAHYDKDVGTGGALFPESSDPALADESSRFVIGSPMIVTREGAFETRPYSASRYLRAIGVDESGRRAVDWEIGGPFSVRERDSATGEFRESSLRIAGADSEDMPADVFVGGSRIGLSPDGRYFVAAGLDGYARLYALQAAAGGGAAGDDGAAGDGAGGALPIGTPPTFTAISRFVGPDPEAVLVSQQLRADPRSSNTGGDDVTAFAFSPDSRYLAVGSHVGSIALWALPEDGSGPARIAVLAPRLDRHVVRDVEFIDGGRLASLGDDGTLRTWRVTPEWAPHLASPHRGGLEASAIDPSGRLAATAGFDGIIRLFDVASGEIVRSLRGHEDWVYSLQFVGGGATLVSGSEDGRAIFWNVATGEAEELEVAQPLSAEYWQTVVSPDGSLIARIGEVGEMLLLDRNTGQVTEIEPREARENYEIYFDGDVPITLAFAAGGERRYFEVWDLATNAVARTVALPPDYPSAFDTSWAAAVADGRVAMPMTDGTIVLFDLATGGIVAELAGHPGFSIEGLDFDASGATLASIAPDGFVRLWDIGANQEIAALRTPSTQARTVALSDDATVVVAGFGGVGGDGRSTVAIWRRPADLEGLVAAARQAFVRDLTPEEARRFYLAPVAE